MPYKIFLSYSWSNSAERRALTSEIAKLESVEALVDREFIQVGDAVHQRILEMIDAADCIIVLLTAEGLQSQEVLDEISRAHDRKKLIIPVVAEGIELKALPWYIRDLNWIQYNQRNFDDVVEKIINTIKRRANPLASINQTQIPPRLKTLIDSGSQFIDIPMPRLVKELSPKNMDDYLFYELKMRQTSAVFVFRTPKVMKIGDAAEFLVAQILPHLRLEDYEWLLVYNNQAVPQNHTFATAGIRSGETVYLLGNHRRPEWMPDMGLGRMPEFR